MGVASDWRAAAGVYAAQLRTALAEGLEAPEQAVPVVDGIVRDLHRYAERQVSPSQRGAFSQGVRIGGAVINRGLVHLIIDLCQRLPGLTPWDLVEVLRLFLGWRIENAERIHDSEQVQRFRNLLARIPLVPDE